MCRHCVLQDWYRIMVIIRRTRLIVIRLALQKQKRVMIHLGKLYTSLICTAITQILTHIYAFFAFYSDVAGLGPILESSSATVPLLLTDLTTPNSYATLQLYTNGFVITHTTHTNTPITIDFTNNIECVWTLDLKDSLVYSSGVYHMKLNSTLLDDDELVDGLLYVIQLKAPPISESVNGSTVEDWRESYSSLFPTDLMTPNTTTEHYSSSSQPPPLVLALVIPSTSSASVALSGARNQWRSVMRQYDICEYKSQDIHLLLSHTHSTNTTNTYTTRSILQSLLVYIDQLSYNVYECMSKPEGRDRRCYSYVSGEESCSTLLVLTISPNSYIGYGSSNIRYVSVCIYLRCTLYMLYTKVLCNMTLN